MYHDELLDHYRYPRYNCLPDNPTFIIKDVLLPSCGDRLTCAGVVQGQVLTQIGFVGKGCVISQASASMLAEYAHGKDSTIIEK